MDFLNDVDELYKIVGEKIKNGRKVRNLTQSDLADGVGLSRTSVTNIESGRQKYPLHKLWEIANFLRIDIRDLLPDEQFLPKNVKAKIPQDFDKKKVSVLLESMGVFESRDDK